jgi:CHAT domain-containing protein
LSSNGKPHHACAELYDVIFKSTSTENKKATLETELGEYQPEVLLWSLDNTLRYVPVAALFDSKRKEYVVEKYQTAIFTRFRPQSFLGKRERWTTGLGLGVSQKELAEIFRDTENGKKGIISGKVLINTDFNQKGMVGELKAKRYPLVHVASHFFFKPGNARKSYLLLGDNDRFTLADMQNFPGLFAGVELLTLSACETSAQQPNVYGTEIDGFAELAQRLGARSVVATLWNVPAEETSRLMVEFYQSQQRNLNWSTAESLRQAQLSFLKGTAGNAKPLTHPHYWGPFVLYGSFR